ERQVPEEAGLRLGPSVAGVGALMAGLWAEELGAAHEAPIAQVRGRGALRGRCRLGILSNSFVGARERESGRYAFDELVERIVYSHEIGVEKPDPEAFGAVCESLGVRPESCLFVDDAEPNVLAARAVGMQAHLFEDNARTIARITAHLQDVS